MNKQMKQHLDAVIDALVESDTAAAKDAFHDYLRLKTQAILIGESVESEEEDKDDKDDKKKPDADGDGKPDWADKKDDKKSDKKEDKDDKKSDKKKKDEEDCEM